LIEDRRSFGPGGLAKEERHPASICPSHSSLVSLPPADGAARPSDSQGGDAAASLRPTQLRPGGPREEETRGGGRSVVPSTSDSCAHFSTHPHRPPGDGAARPPGSLCGVLRRRQERAYDITPAAAPSGSSLQAVHRPPPTAGRDHDVRPFAFRALDIKFYQKRTKSRLLQGIPHSRAHRQSRRRPEDRRSSRGAVAKKRHSV